MREAQVFVEGVEVRVVLPVEGAGASARARVELGREEGSQGGFVGVRDEEAVRVEQPELRYDFLQVPAGPG